MDAGLTPTAMLPIRWSNQSLAYGIDRWQRSILFWDVLRRRGNNYLSHLSAGQPPVLIFDYDTVLDGRGFDPPVNYALVKIRERRYGERDRRRRTRENGTRRQAQPAAERRPTDETMRPLVVIDPRAGHGPGIGGSKIESQIGVALEYGYPVYFITFFPDPMPGQSVADVQQAEIRFLEEVARRHDQAPKPAVIGNCQAGWAAALIGADRPDVVGPMVFNGSPLSYWGGVEGANPMRYKGGLVGGIWPASFWSDVGNGEFDGAHLVAGFEDLNPANTYWKKLYHLFARVDTEAERFLNFEKWWGGYFKLSAEEIHFITRSLFVGNELEKGMLELTENHPIHLKNFKDPIFIFASSGDNITPPPQALNWIVKVYGSVREIKRQGQVIVYMVHEEIGHLGIFVSGKVAAKEHREIISCLDMLEFLVPGLYEMVITENASNPDVGDYCVHFETRDISDILALDDGLEDEEAFGSVAAVSQANDTAYRLWVRPWVRLMTNPWLAAASRQLHPLRMERYLWSDLNPWNWTAALAADQVRAQRQPVEIANPFVELETFMSGMTVAALDAYRDARDLAQEWLFKALYDHAWMKSWWGKAADDQDTSTDKAIRRRERARARRLADQGGFAEAVVRITIAVTGVDHILDKRELARARTIYERHPQYRHLELAELRRMVNTQAHILAVDYQRALDGLAVMLPSRRERKEAIKIAGEIAVADEGVSADENQVLAAIHSRLNLDAG